jgi:hypothetical protein
MPLSWKKLFYMCACTAGAATCTAQDAEPFHHFLTAEASAGYPFYFMQNEGFSNEPNYAGGIAMGFNYSHLKVTTGASYSTKNYYSAYSYTFLNERVTGRHYKLEYLDLSLLAHYKLSPVKLKSRLFATAGLILNFPGNYFVRYEFDSGRRVTNKIDYYRSLGLSARLGLKYEIEFSEKWMFTSDLYGDLKFRKDYRIENGSAMYGSPSSPSLPDDVVSLGINAGIAYKIVFSDKQRKWWKEATGD